MVMLKSIADIVQPCLTPVFTSKLVSLLPTLHVKLLFLENLRLYSFSPRKAKEHWPADILHLGIFNSELVPSVVSRHTKSVMK